MRALPETRAAHRGGVYAARVSGDARARDRGRGLASASGSLRLWSPAHPRGSGCAQSEKGPSKNFLEPPSRPRAIRAFRKVAPCVLGSSPLTARLVQVSRWVIRATTTSPMSRSPFRPRIYGVGRLAGRRVGYASPMLRIHQLGPK